MSLENYIERAKQSTNEDEICNLIKEVIENPQVFVFGELLELPIVQLLKTSSVTSSKWYNLLELFSYGKLSDHDNNTMIELNDQMIKKLRLLTIVSLATIKSKKIPYSLLIEELKVNNLRDLEDLIIEAIYSNLVKGKLDQKENCLEIESTLARDVKKDKLDSIENVLTNWITNCESILANIDKQTKNANSIKLVNKTTKADLENYIANVKKTIKTTQDMDESWEINSIQQQQHHHHEYEKRRGLFKHNKLTSSKNRNRF